MIEILDAILDMFGMKLENRSLPRWFVLIFQLVFGLVGVVVFAMFSVGWWNS